MFKEKVKANMHESTLPVQPIPVPPITSEQPAQMQPVAVSPEAGEPETAPVQPHIPEQMVEPSKLQKIKRFAGKALLKKSAPQFDTESPMYGYAKSGVESDLSPFASNDTSIAETAQAHDAAQEIVRPIIIGEFVKPAPKFLEQVTDTSRTAPIEYVTGVQMQLGTETRGYETKKLSEHESLVGLKDFLVTVANKKPNSHTSLRANSMLENMTFIGKPEYDEATKSIAEGWKQKLRSNPKAQICAIVGRIDMSMVKSDAYLLDNVLKNLTDEELGEFSGRLVLSPDDLTSPEEDVDIIMLDDWTISSNQLQRAAGSIMDRYPQYKHRIQAQLVAATEQRVQDGITVYDDSWDKDATNIPVNAYFAANAAPIQFAEHSQAHITGAHCAVDYDFNNEIAGMAKALDVDMPPATNIVRPYRNGVKLTQTSRLQGLGAGEAVPKKSSLFLGNENVPFTYTELENAIY